MRLRIIFSKSGALRYTGHLDLQTTWERTIRRAGLPLAYTHGFHPGPRIQIASALPLGFIGRREIVDIWLQGDVGVIPVPGNHESPGGHEGRSYAEALQSAAPPGLAILSVEQVDEAGPALQTRVVSAEYEIALLDPLEDAELEKRLVALLGAVSLPRERRGKPYDLRPLIEELSIMRAPALTSTPAAPDPDAASAGGPACVQVEEPRVRVCLRLAAREGATARPEEVLDVLGILPETTRIERTRLILKSEMD